MVTLSQQRTSSSEWASNFNRQRAESMTIKSKMLLIILVGIGGLFLANFYASMQLNTAHKQYSSDESLTAHSSAWFSNMDTQFVSNLLTFDPMDGSERNASFWDPDADAFGESEDANPLFAPSVARTPRPPPHFLSRCFQIQSWRSKSPLR